jgi:hypothetical protein
VSREVACRGREEDVVFARPVGMSERGIHYIEPDLDETWLPDWVGVGLVELEAYLDKHAAFLDFLRARENGSS